MATVLSQTQADFDNLGRIKRDAYVGSVSALFAICWLAAAVRFHIRFGILKTFSWDDFFLILGLVFMTTMFGLLMSCVNDAYATAAVLAPGGLTLALRPGFMQKLFHYKKTIDAVLMLAWAAILCVKLSYLFLFRRLVDRVHLMGLYWWFVFLYIVGTAGYVFAAYYLVCPFYDSFLAIQCITGDGIAQTIRYTISQIVLDIIGDLFILVFPFYIIYKIKVATKQKLGLAISLCLTVVIIAMSIIRIAGIMTPDDKLDQLWDGYWNIISAQVGLIMTSATAFRALYVSVSNSSSGRRQNNNPSGATPGSASTSSTKLSRLATWWRRTRDNSRTHSEKNLPRSHPKNVSAATNSTFSSNNSKHHYPIQGAVSQVPSQIISQREIQSQMQHQTSHYQNEFQSNNHNQQQQQQQQHQSYQSDSSYTQSPAQTYRNIMTSESSRRSTVAYTNTNTNTNTNSNTNGNTSSSIYESQSRVSQLFADQWDDARPAYYVDSDLLTKRALIEEACRVYRRDTAV